MRSEQIDMIREWLSPAKTSDANFRIECTVVRDLLDSEIEYVGALRLVVQVHLLLTYVSWKGLRLLYQSPTSLT